MSSHRKPQPKSQKEISSNLVNPYVNPEDGTTLGNPNQTNFNQFTADEQSGLDHNRSSQLTFKDDTSKPFTLGFTDIDESIMYYFQNVIKPSVIQNGEKIQVPIIYGSPERWKSTQKDGYYKDKNGQIMSPLIMFKRGNITKNRAVWKKMDANSPHLYTSWRKVHTQKSTYSNFNILNNRTPTYQFIVNVIPDYVTITYSCIIQTYYMEQLNKIIEAINYSSDSYWGNPETFKFKASIDQFSPSVEFQDGKDRIAKSTFEIKLYGYIVPDNIQKEINSIKKYNSKSQILLGLEVDGSPSTGLSNITNANSRTTFTSPTPIVSSSGNGINPSTLVYLNTNIQKIGTFIDPTTVTFNSGWVSAPSGLPSTSINNFSIFINGVLIDNSSVSSFTEINNETTLVIDPSILGYNLDPQDEIIAIGKFIS
jgi:hypothetical protein